MYECTRAIRHQFVLSSVLASALQDFHKHNSVYDVQGIHKCISQQQIASLANNKLNCINLPRLLGIMLTNANCICWMLNCITSPGCWSCSSTHHMNFIYCNKYHKDAPITYVRLFQFVNTVTVFGLLTGSISWLASSWLAGIFARLGCSPIVLSSVSAYQLYKSSTSISCLWIGPSSTKSYCHPYPHQLYKSYTSTILCIIIQGPSSTKSYCHLYRHINCKRFPQA